MVLLPWKLSLLSHLDPPYALVRHAGKSSVWMALAMYYLTCWLIPKQSYLDFRLIIHNIGMTFLPLILWKKCFVLFSHVFLCFYVHLPVEAGRQPHLPFLMMISTWLFKSGSLTGLRLIKEARMGWDSDPQRSVSASPVLRL